MTPPSTPNRPNGCQGNSSCQNGGRRCESLKKQLQAIDFSIVETVLYLDAYPNCKKALAHYHTLIHERKELVARLAEECHMPITHCENASKDSWDWINNPWPWELDAND
jgi:spore coat protein JB